MNFNEIMDDLFPGILEISKKIYSFAETGSSEHESSTVLKKYLESQNFNVETKYMDMETAFRSENGKKGLRIGLLAEYDALPNGHSCGHNLISAWAVGTAAAINRIDNDICVTVFGTPSEEGIGPYAGSKCVMAGRGAFKDLDLVIGVHPDDKWGVGSKALADLTLELRFLGKSAHGADSPDKGINALDAAVATYNVINSLRGWAKLDKHLVVGMIFTESGKATNVVPERATLQVEMRSTSTRFLSIFEKKVRDAALGIGEAYGASVDIEQVTPLYKTYINNNSINHILQENLLKLGISALDEGMSGGFASGSTDEANVSWKVPTGHLDFPIGYPGIAGHSDEFREAADPNKAAKPLRIAIEATVLSVLQIKEENRMGEIKKEFKEGDKDEF
ncbi:MAG: M20 family metallopeptidase [Cuniculiplasma sp.]